jgi:SAM-dependent methyltransferase
MTLPTWAGQVLTEPGGARAVHAEGTELLAGLGKPVAEIVDGVVNFPLAGDDRSIAYYESIGGTHFHERSSMPFAMSSLDTPLYHAYLSELRPVDPDRPVIDVGGGDGRNAQPWLRWGHRQVVVIDPVLAALKRFRDRIAAENSAWLNRCLLVRADARMLPLATASAARVQAIESLCYLCEDYEIGLSESVRVLAKDGLLLLSDRDREASLLLRLLYFGGVGGMLDQAKGPWTWDGEGSTLVRTRTFTGAEIETTVEKHGMKVLSHRGMPLLSLILGFLQGLGRLSASDEARINDLQKLLQQLGREGLLRRCHVIVARHAAT